jgi:DNA replication protein DnaC
LPTSTPEKRCRVCGTPGRYVGAIDGIVVHACDEHFDQERKRIADFYHSKRSERRIELELDAGRRYEDWRLKYLEDVDPAVLERVRQWVGEFDTVSDYWLQNLVIFGDVGVGKSTLAFAAAVAAIEESKLGWSRKVRWVAVRPLLAAVRASFNGGPAPDIDLGPETDVLVLDDLGAERATEWTRDWLANVIEQRYDHGQCTIVTTNYPPSRLAARLGGGDVVIGQRLVSRLVDDAVVLELRGADRRKRAA